MNAMRKDIRICGSGGQGVILLSVILAKAYGMYEGFEIAQSQAYGPEARGGACHADLVVSDQPIDYIRVEKAHVLVAMNQPGYLKYRTAVTPDVRLFVDTTFLDEVPQGGRGINATELAEQHLKPFVANIVMLGFMAAQMEDISYDSIKQALAEHVPAKALDINLQALEMGYKRGLAQ